MKLVLTYRPVPESASDEDGLGLKLVFWPMCGLDWSKFESEYATGTLTGRL